MQEVTSKFDNNANAYKVLEFLNPRYIFLPLDKKFKLKVRDGEYVYKNDIVAINNKEDKMLFSSISGYVLGVKDMDYIGKNKVPSLVIENDFKENIRVRKSVKKYLNTITKSEFLNILEDTSLYYKNAYMVEKLKSSHNSLIVNAIDLEPSFKNKSYILKENVEDILETIDLIASVIDSSKIVFTLKNNDSSIINSVMNAIGTYPNIEVKLLNDEYPNGMEEILKKTLNLPDALVLDVEEVYAIYEVLKREVPLTEKYISIFGEGVREGTIIKVKIGSLLSEVFVSICDFSKSSVDVYLNGLIYGNNVNTLKYVIDTNIDGIYVEEKSKGTENLYKLWSMF